MKLCNIRVFFVVAAGSLLLCCCDATSEDHFQPEQVHLSLGADETQMVVTWVTLSPTTSSVVEFGPASDNKEFTETKTGSLQVYEDPGSERRRIFIHRVVLTGLNPGKSYRYHCGDPAVGWSSVFSFRALPNDETFNPRFLIYGDLGCVNDQAMSSLVEQVQTSVVDAVLHVGDFAYDMPDDNGRRGDEFMRLIEPIAAYVPYQVCPGNHESLYNFSNYDARFSMLNKQQGATNNFYHSFNVGPVHFVAISTEFYYYLEFGFEQIESQYNWLIKDLEEANLPENRQKRPWIFLFGHRPMYCTNQDLRSIPITAEQRDCSTRNSITRTGMPFTHEFALEPLLKKYGIDIFWSGHQHSYERLWPIFNGTVSGRDSSSYINPSSPIHIITGSPGNQEGLAPFANDVQRISAFRTADYYTYTRVQFANKTHLEVEQIAVPQGHVVDSISIGKDSAIPKWQQADLSKTASVLL